MEVRALPLERTDDAVALWRETGLTRPWNDPYADLERALAGATSTVLAGLDGSDLIATAMTGTDGHRGWVYYLAVAPRRQGSGVGRQMMAAVEQWLRERQVGKVQLMVRRDNAAARGFYRGLGYEDADVTVLARWL